MEIVENFRANNDQTIEAAAGRFMVMQRNIGYVDNDGRWTVELLPELYWSKAGILRRRRPGSFVGVFDSTDEALVAIKETELPEIKDEMVR